MVRGVIAARIERFSLAIGGALAALGSLRICGCIFGCGCTATSDARCNVHLANAPHCPWCTIGPSGLALVALSVVLVQACMLLVARRRFGRRLGTSLGAVVVGLALGALSAGLVSALWRDYPFFLGIAL
jgi:hypothetical protein